MNFFFFYRLLKCSNVWVVSIFHLLACCHHAYRRLYIDLSHSLQKISLTIKESLVEHETKCRRRREVRHAILFRFRFIFWARITTIEMTKLSRVSAYSSFDHRSRSLDASTTRILLLDDRWHSSSSLRTQVLWSKPSRSVFISFRECYADSTKRSHTDACQTLFCHQINRLRMNDEFSIVSATSDDLDRKNSKTHFLFDLSIRSLFEMSSLHSKQALSVYTAYSQSEMMLCIRSICCRRSPISARSEQPSCASGERRMIGGAVVISLAQDCSIAWLFYS